MTVQNQVLTFKEKKTLQTRKAEVEQIRAKVNSDLITHKYDSSHFFL